MQRSSVNVLADAFLLVVAVLWVVWVSADYFGKFVLYGIALENFVFYGLAAKLVLFVLVQVLLVHYKRKQVEGWIFTGWWLVLNGLVFIFLVNQETYNAVLASSGKFPSRPLYPVAALFSGIGGPLLFLLSAYATGDFLLQTLGLSFRKNDMPILRIITGFGAWMTVLFFLGIIGGLTSLIIIPLCLLPVALRYKSVLSWARRLFLFSHKEFASQLKPVGVVSLLGLVMVISVNLMRIQTPLPTGSDAQNYYINLARLIDSYNGLVHGFQPYNWSLVASLGYFIGNGTPAALVFSMLGGVLSLFVLYRLGRSILNADANAVLFSLLLFALTPTMVVQSVAELKVDLGLLFLSLGTLLLFWYIIRSKKWGSQDSPALLLLFGACCGWILGIKLTSLFLVMGLVSALWYRKIGQRGLFAAVLFALGISLLAGMDKVIQIDSQHLGRIWVMAACLVSGGVLVAIEFLNHRERLLKVLRQTGTILLCAALTFLPWVVKNGIETGSWNPRKLLMGAEPGVDLNIGDIRELMKE